MSERNNGDQSVMDCRIRHAEQIEQPVAEIMAEIEELKEDYKEIRLKYPTISSVQMAIRDVPVAVMREIASQINEDCKYVECFEMMRIQHMVDIYFTIWLYSPKLEVQTRYVETTAFKNV